MLGDAGAVCVSAAAPPEGQSDEADRPQPEAAAEAEASSEVVTLVLQFSQPQLALEPTDRSDRVLLAASHGQLELRSPAPGSPAACACSPPSSRPTR